MALLLEVPSVKFCRIAFRPLLVLQAIFVGIRREFLLLRRGNKSLGKNRAVPFLGTRERGHYERGLFTGGISRISTFSKFSRISRKWQDSPLFSTVWGFSKISRISIFSRFSRKWTFLKDPLFQKTPFSEPDFLNYCH